MINQPHYQSLPKRCKTIYHFVRSNVLLTGSSRDTIFRGVHNIIDDDIGEEPPAVVLPTVTLRRIPQCSMMLDPMSLLSMIVDVVFIADHDAPDDLVEQPSVSGDTVLDDTSHQRGVSDASDVSSSETDQSLIACVTVLDPVIPVETDEVIKPMIIDDPIPVTPLRPDSCK